jgi:hypothetical protein
MIDSLTNTISSLSGYLCYFIFRPNDSLVQKVLKVAGLVFAGVCLGVGYYRKFQATYTPPKEPPSPALSQPNTVSVEPEPTTLEGRIAKLLSSPGIVKDMLRASNGKIPVYFPTEFPTIVLKEAGYGCEGRIQQMDIARAICQKIENGSTLLVIPQSFGIVNKTYLIEERLPLQHIDSFKQRELYYLHQKELEPVICAMTHFVLRSHLGDLIDLHDGFPRGFRPPRYDNIPFFKTNDGIKIGLIDLESMKKDMNPKEARLDSVTTLVYLYPYHKETIIKAASSYFSQEQLTSIADELNHQEARGKQLLQIRYVDLITHLQNHSNRKIMLSEEIKNTILEEIDADIKRDFPENSQLLTSKEKEEISQELSEIVDVLNTIKTTKKGPFRKFNSAYFNAIEGSHHELECTFYHDPRKVLKGDANTLLYYLLQKLENHKVFYGCDIQGFNGVLVD